jgi:PAS domain S-box-containing protein
MLGLAMSGSRMGAWSRNLLTDEVYWSPELEAIFGLPAGAFSGNLAAYYELVHPEDRERVRREVWEAIDGRRGYVIEFRYRHADGSERWMEGRGQAIYSAEGKPTQVFGIGIDITERKRAALNAEFIAEVADDLVRVSTPEEIVRAIGGRLNGFLGTSTCAFVEVSETAATATINYEWHREGVPSLVGVYRLPEFVTPEFMRAARSGETVVIRDATTDPRVADPRPWSELKIGAHVNVPLIQRGEWRFSLCVYHAEPYDWREDEVSLLRDLAPRVWTRLERALAEQEREGLLKREHAARVQAEEASRLKDEFLATVSHELRTPLTAILGWSSILRTGSLPPDKQARALETVERSARAQAQIVDDLLDISRIVAGRMRLDMQPVRLEPVVEAALDAVRPSAAARDIRIETQLEPGTGPVKGDAQRLQQVAWNLLTNAIKFTPDGGRVGLRLRRVEEHVELQVTDSGKGIDPAFLPHVFERFRQADGSSTRRHGGLGLGLAIVRHLVELHGGTVQAHSEGEGHGSSFTLRLPLAAARTPEAASSTTPPVITDPSLAAYLPDLSGVRVLVVDDEQSIRELLRALLEERGAAVSSASSAAEALEQLQRAPPDVLVSDIGMPDADGYAFIRQVRALPPAKGGQVPAAALTAYTRLEDRTRALSAGFQVYVPKPVDPIELVMAIANLINRFARS